MAPQPQRPWILQQTEQSEQINPQVPGPEKLVYEGGKNHHVSDPQRCPPFLTFDFGLANCLVWIVLDRPGSSWLDWLDWLDPPAARWTLPHMSRSSTPSSTAACFVCYPAYPANSGRAPFERASSTVFAAVLALVPEPSAIDGPKVPQPDSGGRTRYAR